MEPLSAGHPNPSLVNCPLSLLNNAFWMGDILSILQLWQKFFPCLIYRTKLTFCHTGWLLVILEKPGSAFRYSKGDQPSMKCFGNKDHKTLVFMVQTSILFNTHSSACSMCWCQWLLIGLLLPTDITVSISTTKTAWITVNVNPGTLDVRKMKSSFSLQRKSI